MSKITNSRQAAFALPTVLISSVIMLMVLVAAVSITIAIRTALDEERYNRLAEMSAEAGTSYALACIEANNGTVTWGSIPGTNDLKPETDCNGNTVGGRSAYVLQRSDFQTKFLVKRPLLGAGNQPLSVSALGYVELLRKSTGTTWRTFQNSDVVALGGQIDATPVGGSIEGYWTSAPQGYLLEDGSAVSRTTYASLFSIIGTTFGAGDGSTTFNLPDSRGRVAVARSNDAEFASIGQKSGTKTHQLSVAELPSHQHDFAGQTIAWGPSAGSVYFKQHEETHRVIATGGAAIDNNGMYTCSGCGDWIDTGNTGSSGSHNNIQPYIVALRVIKF